MHSEVYNQNQILLYKHRCRARVRFEPITNNAVAVQERLHLKEKMDEGCLS
jgi:hypothetical protein